MERPCPSEKELFSGKMDGSIMQSVPDSKVEWKGLDKLPLVKLVEDRGFDNMFGNCEEEQKNAYYLFYDVSYKAGDEGMISVGTQVDPTCHKDTVNQDDQLFRQRNQMWMSTLKEQAAKS